MNRSRMGLACLGAAILGAQSGFGEPRELNLPGRTVPVARAEVAAGVAGVITEQLFRPGAEVKKGDVLFRMDSGHFKATVERAESVVEERRAKLTYLEANLRRKQQLVKTKAVSEDAVESALCERDSARAALKAAEAELVLAKGDLAACEITSPITGFIGTPRISVGNRVLIDSDPLVPIVSSRPIRVRFSLPSGEFLRMFGGRGSVACTNSVVRLTLPDGTRLPESGRIEYVENEMDESTDSVRMYASFDNSELMLRPGGTVAIALSRRSDARSTSQAGSAK